MMKKNKFAHFLRDSVLGLAFAGTALSALGIESRKTPAQDDLRAPIEALGDPFEPSPRPLAGDQSRIVFYRPDSLGQKNAFSIFVNDSYHASLSHGGYSPICLTSTTVRLGMRHSSVANRAKDGMDMSTAVSLKRGKTLYMRVRESSSGPWSLEPVQENEALMQLARTRLQIHTISRVDEAEDCRFPETRLVEPAPLAQAIPPRPLAAPAPLARQSSPKVAGPKRPATQRFVLATDMLFQPHTPQSLNYKLSNWGQAELGRLMAQLRHDYQSIETAKVIAYTDPLSEDAVRISRRRAETVVDYFQAHGFRSKRTSAIGGGSSNLVASRCGKKPTVETLACNQPNRRIIFVVTGIRA